MRPGQSAEQHAAHAGGTRARTAVEDLPAAGCVDAGIRVDVQALPLGYVSSSRSHPLDSLASQLARPGSHAATTHVPVAQVSVASGMSHTTPQPPQLLSDVAGVSQPFGAFPSQLA